MNLFVNIDRFKGRRDSWSMPVISTIRNITKSNENGNRNPEDTNKKWGFDPEKMMTFSRKRPGSEDDFESFI